MKGERRTTERWTGRKMDAVHKAKSLLGLSMQEVMLESDSWVADGKVRQLRHADWFDSRDDSLLLSARLFRFTDKSSLIVLLMVPASGVLTLAFGREHWRHACQIMESDQVHPDLVDAIAEGYERISAQDNIQRPSAAAVH